MAAGVNKIILLGHLGRDPELRYTQAGMAMTKFSLATTSFRQNKEGKTMTEWHNVVTFGRLAEVCGEYLRKGRQIFVEGRISTRSYMTKDGSKAWFTEVVAEQVQMLGRKEDTREAGEALEEVTGPLEESLPF